MPAPSKTASVLFTIVFGMSAAAWWPRGTAAQQVDASAKIHPDVLPDGSIHSERLYLRETPLPAHRVMDRLEAPIPAWKNTDVFTATGTVYAIDPEQGVHVLWKEPERRRGSPDGPPGPPATKSHLTATFDG